MSAETRTLRARKAAISRHHPGRDLSDIDDERLIARVREVVDQLPPLPAEAAQRVADILKSVHIRHEPAASESAAS